jgi:hypothetical protein
MRWICPHLIIRGFWKRPFADQDPLSLHFVITLPRFSLCPLTARRWARGEDGLTGTPFVLTDVGK